MKFEFRLGMKMQSAYTRVLASGYVMHHPTGNSL